MRKQEITFKNPNRPAIVYIAQTKAIQPISDMHFHIELEFLHILSGALKVYVENREYLLKEGDIIFINSNTPHGTDSLSEDTSYCIAQFRKPSLITSTLTYLPEFLTHSSRPIYLFKKDDPDYDELAKALAKMNTENKNQALAYDYYITANIYAIIALLYRKNLLSSENQFTDHGLIEKIIPVFEYIDENYYNDISLSELAEQVNLNKDYLCRLFKKATRGTISDYVNHVRIAKAEELLKKNLTVSEVSYSVGFSSLSYFNTVFKKNKHCSPSTYKKIYSHSGTLME